MWFVLGYIIGLLLTWAALDISDRVETLHDRPTMDAEAQLFCTLFWPITVVVAGIQCFSSVWAWIANHIARHIAGVKG